MRLANFVHLHLCGVIYLAWFARLSFSGAPAFRMMTDPTSHTRNIPVYREKRFALRQQMKTRKVDTENRRYGETRVLMGTLARNRADVWKAVTFSAQCQSVVPPSGPQQGRGRSRSRDQGRSRAAACAGIRAAASRKCGGALGNTFCAAARFRIKIYCFEFSFCSFQFLCLEALDWYSKPPFLKIWVPIPSGVVKFNFGSRNKLARQIRYKRFCKLYKKIRSRPAMNFTQTFLSAKTCCMLSVI